MFAINTAELVAAMISVTGFLATLVVMLGKKVLEANEKRFRKLEKSHGEIIRSLHNIELGLTARGIRIRTHVAPDDDEESTGEH
jgi:hypothetical protein